MAVNYGLGGFKNGAAYVSASNASSGAIDTNVQDEFFPINLEMNSQSNLNITIEETYKFQINLQGIYYIKYSITSSGANGDDFTAGISINESAAESFGRTMFNSKQADEYTSNSSTILQIQGNTNITFLIANNSASPDPITIEKFNVAIIRIGDLATQSENFLSGNSCLSLQYSGTDAFSYTEKDIFFKIDYTLTKGIGQQIESPDNNIKIIQDGFYLIDWSLSTSGSSNDNFTIGLMKNGETDSDVLSYPQQRFNIKGGSLFQTGFQGLLQLKENDTIAFAIANNTDTTGTTKFRQNNIVIIRLGNI